MQPKPLPPDLSPMAALDERREERAHERSMAIIGTIGPGIFSVCLTVLLALDRVTAEVGLPLMLAAWGLGAGATALRKRKPKPAAKRPGSMATLILVLGLIPLASCGPKPPPQGPGKPPGIVAQAWSVVWPHIRAALPELLGLLLGNQADQRAPAPMDPSWKPAGIRGTAEASVLQLLEVRRWARPASEGRRVRLSTAPDGRLLVAYGQHLGGSQYRALLEDAVGQQLDAEPYLTQRAPKVHRVGTIGTELLYRDEDRLEVAGALVVRGGWESYSGLEGLILAWKTCEPRPCWASILNRQESSWSERTWQAETFGLDLARASSSTVAIASRENPLGAGWTLRIADEGLLRQGKVQELGIWRWKPPAGLSLEDPHLVRGAPVPTVIGEAYDLRAGPAGAPSGRVFLAEAGGTLREVLQAAATTGNSEVYGVMHQGRLYVAAETQAGKSGLWGWVNGQGLQLVDQVPGGAPSVASAEGQLSVSTTAGLWTLGP